jgi:hypothetical protein
VVKPVGHGKIAMPRGPSSDQALRCASRASLPVPDVDLEQLLERLDPDEHAHLIAAEEADAAVRPHQDVKWR